MSQEQCQDHFWKFLSTIRFARAGAVWGTDQVPPSAHLGTAKVALEANCEGASVQELSYSRVVRTSCRGGAKGCWHVWSVSNISRLN